MTTSTKTTKTRTRTAAKVGGDEPWTFGFTPLEVTTEPGTYKGVRSQRVRVRIGYSPDGQPLEAWLTVHEDGRLTLGSYSHGFRLEYLTNHRTGSSVSLSTYPLAAAGELPPELDDVPAKAGRGDHGDAL
jgi:hypothetical protein